MSRSRDMERNEQIAKLYVLYRVHGNVGEVACK